MSDDLIGDLEECIEAAQGRGGCKVCSVRPGLTNERRDALDRALSAKVGEEKLARILNRHGFKIGRVAIRRHRTECGQA